MTPMLGPMRERAHHLLARYAEAYLAGDAEGVVDLCEVPFVAVRHGVPIHLVDRVAVIGHFLELIDAYRAAGAATAEIAQLDVFEQGSAAAVATVTWRVAAADGRLIREFRTSYQLVGHDTWRIIGYVNHDTIAPG